MGRRTLRPADHQRAARDQGGEQPLQHLALECVVEFDGVPDGGGFAIVRETRPCPGTGRLVAVFRAVPEASRPRDGDDVAFGRGAAVAR
jgi:hypothetical protein